MQVPPKVTLFGIFGLKICHLATLTLTGAHLKPATVFWTEHGGKVLGRVDDQPDPVALEEVDVQGGLVAANIKARVRIPRRAPHLRGNYGKHVMLNLKKAFSCQSRYYPGKASPLNHLNAEKLLKSKSLFKNRCPRQRQGWIMTFAFFAVIFLLLDFYSKIFDLVSSTI
jgi:hypothetical protein